MTLKDIEINPDESLIYLDRYVNDGSPSGFTEKNTTSPDTNPFSLNKCFKLFVVESDEINFKIYGSLSSSIPLNGNQFYIHPDMRKNAEFKGCKIMEENEFSVSPTSSFRTVKIHSEICNDYVKLHYDGIIGRIYRQLYPMRAIAGVEISSIIKEKMRNDTLSNFISIFEEPFAKIFMNPILKDNNKFWGMVWRTAKPIGKRSEKIKYIIPLFSFWSIDRIDNESEIFGKQLFMKWGANAKTKFISEILLPILDLYFEFLVKIGLQNEYNAQNLMVGFDEDWNAVSIINRDMMGIEKDTGLIKSLGQPITFDSYPYKMLEQDNPLYSIRHSFTFDFKVCKYVIEPLLNLATNCELATQDELIELLRERTKYWMCYLPKDFFPMGKWYSHDKVLLTVKGNREYIENKYPLLRD